MTRTCTLYCNYLFFRTLSGPEEAEAGSLSPPMGRHLLCAPGTHVHVTGRAINPRVPPPTPPQLLTHRPYCHYTSAIIHREDLTIYNIDINC